MATSDKLTYLNTTKGLIKDAINNAGANITNDTFRSYATTLGTAVSKMRTDRDTLVGNGVVGTSTGSISGALDYPLNELKMTKESTQDGTPTPENPVEIKTVKGYRNLFDISKILTNGERVINNNNGTLTINTPSTTAGVTALTPNKLSDYCPSLKVGDTVYLNADTTGTTKRIYLSTSGSYWNFGASRTITQNDLDSIVNWYASGVSTSATISNIMITSVANVPYIPYGTNWIYSKIIGKNYTNINTYIEGAINTAGVFFTGGVSNFSNQNGVISFTADSTYKGFCSQYEEIKPNTSYVCSYKMIIDANYNGQMCWYDKDKQFISRESIRDNMVFVPRISPTNAKYVRLSIYKVETGNGSLSEIQLEEGQTPTIYETYKEKYITLPLNDNEIVGIDNYKDQYIIDRNGHCYLNKKTCKIILNGSETIQVVNTNTTGNYRFYITIISPTIIKNTTVVTKLGLYCDKLIETTRDQNYGKTQGICYVGTVEGNRLSVYTDTTKEMTSTQFKSWLESNNLIVYAILETPQLIDLNYIVDMRLFNGINNITNSEDMDMAIKYVEDINTILATLTTPQGGNE